MTALLEVEDLCAGYGEFNALFDLDLRVDVGETVAIIGANGAGKSTLLRCLTGMIDATSGRATFDGHDLLASPAHRRPAMGLAMVPEGRKLFPSLSVRENLLVGAHAQRGHDLTEPWTVDRVLDLFPLIGPLLDRPSAVLSGGEKQAVAIGRALMSNPTLLLMDECSLGLAPIVVRDLYRAVPEIRSAGTSIVVVEQDIGQALGIADRFLCLLEGRVVLSGAPADHSRDAVSAAYFGLEAKDDT